MITLEIRVKHVYQDRDNPDIQTIVYDGDGPGLHWLFEALITLGKDFDVAIYHDKEAEG